MSKPYLAALFTNGITNLIEDQSFSIVVCFLYVICEKRIEILKTY
jgi:hypothetical protein